jgi:enterochelin esterase-like enzyme
MKAYLIILLTALSWAQAQSPTTNAVARQNSGPIYSPEVGEDHRVTFRLRAPEAREVKVSGEWGATESLTKSEQGVWTGTVGPLKPELYGYNFVVDGLRIADPGNPKLKPMRSPVTSILDIPGKTPLLHDFRDVPHGSVNTHYYYNKELESWRRVQVYTPPGYHKSKQRYPVLYLFHGSGDNDATWTELGRANIILDNLLAENKAMPMIVVMPDGHPIAGRITGVPGPEMIQRNVEAFANDVLTGVMPLVEKEYRVINKRQSRAVAGLSMGGGQSLHLGLNHPELFNYVGGFSSYVVSPGKNEFAIFNTKEKPELIWTACGKDDRLIENARELSTRLKEKGIEHKLVETEGNHSWPVWRKYLAEFAPMLFQKRRGY